MDADPDRIDRALEAELGQCRPEDVDVRLGELQALVSEANQESIAADIRALKTLGNETRYQLARILTAAAGELCVCELSVVVDVSDSAISHALSDLRDAGLATRRKDGRWRMYQSTPLAESIIAALNDPEI